MADLARRMKNHTLTPPEAAILRRLILRRTNIGARREFRGFCRLVSQIEKPEFTGQVQPFTAAGTPAQQHRAGFALGYFATA